MITTISSSIRVKPLGVFLPRLALEASRSKRAVVRLLEEDCTDCIQVDSPHFDNLARSKGDGKMSVV
jgi:hypothetical protein